MKPISGKTNRMRFRGVFATNLMNEFRFMAYAPCLNAVDHCINGKFE